MSLLQGDACGYLSHRTDKVTLEKKRKHQIEKLLSFDQDLLADLVYPFHQNIIKTIVEIIKVILFSGLLHTLRSF